MPVIIIQVIQRVIICSEQISGQRVKEFDMRFIAEVLTNLPRVRRPVDVRLGPDDLTAPNIDHRGLPELLFR